MKYLEENGDVYDPQVKVEQPLASRSLKLVHEEDRVSTLGEDKASLETETYTMKPRTRTSR